MKGKMNGKTYWSINIPGSDQKQKRLKVPHFQLLTNLERLTMFFLLKK